VLGYTFLLICFIMLFRYNHYKNNWTNIMNKLLSLLLFCIITSQAQVIDAVAIDVEGQAITIIEIQAVQQNLKISKEAAVEMLIRDRLEKAAIINAGITISDEEVQQKVEAIARAKQMTISQMKTLLEKKGLTWEGYLKQMKLELQKERFFQEHILSTIARPSDAELETYYNLHKDEFDSTPIQMSLVAYQSDSLKLLKEAIANPMRPISGVTKKSILASSDEMSPALLNLIQQTPANSFTKPINTGKGFIAYFVKSKGSKQSGFEAVKQAVFLKWMQSKRVQASKDFMNKLKSNAKIRVIRL